MFHIFTHQWIIKPIIERQAQIGWCPAMI